MTWRAGVDVLSFGATKNGALACEAVVFFDPERAADFAYQRKRGGHTLSKGRFLGAQMEAYLEGGLWLDLARRANAPRRGSPRGSLAAPGVRRGWPTEANEVFVVAPNELVGPLARGGREVPRLVVALDRPGAGSPRGRNDDPSCRLVRNER